MILFPRAYGMNAREHRLFSTPPDVAPTASTASTAPPDAPEAVAAAAPGGAPDAVTLALLAVCVMGALGFIISRMRRTSGARFLVNSAAEGLERVAARRKRERTAEPADAGKELFLFRDIFLHTGEGVAVTDKDGLVLNVNPAFTAITGRPAGEAVGRPSELFLSENQGACCGAMRRELADKGCWEGELLLTRKDGAAFPCRVSVSGVRDEAGDISHHAVFFHDITALKQAERDLVDAKELAEKANRSKSLFLANMSHELRTPLNGMIGVGNLLLDTELDDEQQELLSLSLNSSKHLLGVVNDLLEFSSLEVGKVALSSAVFPLRRELDILHKGLSLQAEACGLEYFHDVEADVPDLLVGDAGRVRQVLVNLLGNALKFTEEGAVITTVRLADPVEGPGGRVRLLFSVSDTGVGVADDKLDEIFNSFTLGEDVQSKKYGGAGLGLSICKKLVEHMGGEIWVESELGMGSAFLFTLPFEVAEEGCEGVEVCERLRKRTGGPARILIVEDEAINRLTAGRLLGKCGYETGQARDGLEALQMLEREAYDAVLMDVQMPNLNGLEATRCIRRGDVPGLDAGIPVIALTAYAMASDRELCFASGMDDIITKPFEIGDLQKTLEKHLDRRDG